MTTVEEIKQIISQENLNISQLAKKIEISAAVLAQVLSGRRKPPLEIQQKINFYCESIKNQSLISRNNEKP